MLFVFVFFGWAIASAGAQTDVKPNYPRFNFNVGGGEGIGRGDAGAFSGNSFFAVGGAGWNFNKIFGASVEYMYYALPIRPSVAIPQQLGSANASLNAISLNGIVKVPYKVGRYGAYGIFGVGFYDRNSYSNTGNVNLALCQTFLAVVGYLLFQRIRSRFASAIARLIHENCRWLQLRRRAHLRPEPLAPRESLRGVSHSQDILQRFRHGRLADHRWIAMVTAECLL